MQSLINFILGFAIVSFPMYFIIRNMNKDHED